MTSSVALDDALANGYIDRQTYNSVVDQQSQPPAASGFQAPSPSSAADQAALWQRFAAAANGSAPAPNPTFSAQHPALAAAPIRQAPYAQQGQSAAPVASGAPSPSDDGGDPGQAMLSAYLQRGAGPAHAQGMSAADKGYLGQLQDQGSASAANTSAALGQVQGLAANFAAQTDALTSESKVGIDAFKKSQIDEAQHRAALAQETKDAQSRIGAKLSELEAQGVDPNRYWQRMGTGGQIASAIMVGLGGMAVGLNRNFSGQNPALEIINGAISRDIDAQKANLQRGLEVAGKQVDLNAQGFNQQEALLRAERDSTQTAYTLAQSELAKRGALFGANSDVQTSAARMSAALQQTAEDKVGQLNDRLYQLRKNAEKVVQGSGNPLADKIRDLSVKLQEQGASAGHNYPPEAYQRLAAQYVLGTDVSPGKPAIDVSKPAIAPGGKGAQQVNALEQALKGVDQLIAMRQSAGLIRGPEATARAQASALDARTAYAQGVGSRLSPEAIKNYSALIPEDPLEHNVSGLVGQDPTMQRMMIARRHIAERLAEARANPAGDTSASEALDAAP